MERNDCIYIVNEMLKKAETHFPFALIRENYELFFHLFFKTIDEFRTSDDRELNDIYELLSLDPTILKEAFESFLGEDIIVDIYRREYASPLIV